ncbi:MAG: hypothetical protein EYC62_00125 [Alphaproteobacteria bacterium]|nr:MAG: hypothetical protein EYC62_00125 [Alphaproteobacteria bacterium]
MPKLSKLDQARLELFARIPHCAPDFMVEPWNKNNLRQISNFLDLRYTKDWNNCYAYAANDPEIHRCPNDASQDPAWPRPGMEQQPVNIFFTNNKKLRHSIVKDGLIYAGKKYPQPKPGTYIIAAYTCVHKQHANDKDYHFYRLDRSGTWSHKNATALPVDQNNKLKPITSARQDVKHYGKNIEMQFVGYFYVPNSGIILGSRNRVFLNPTSTEQARKTPFDQPDLIQAKIMRTQRQRAVA